MSNKTLGIAIVIIILVAAGVVGAIRVMRNNNPEVKNDTSNTQTQTPANNADQSPANTAGNQPAANQPANDAMPIAGCTRNFNADTLKTAKVDIANKFVTLDVKNFGTIKIQLYDKDAPKAVENFLRLVNAGYYDCLTFHRVAKGFVVQGGDPTGTGSGGDSAFGGAFVDELNPQTASYKAGYVKGTVAMANSGPNTNGSQFFIMLADADLPHNYTIFGKVVSGQPAVDKIGAVDIVPQLGPTDGTPKDKVVITKATISAK